MSYHKKKLINYFLTDKDKPREETRDKHRQESNEEINEDPQEENRDERHERHRDERHERHRDERHERHRDERGDRHRDERHERHRDERGDRHRDERHERHRDERHERHRDERHERHRDERRYEHEDRHREDPREDNNRNMYETINLNNHTEYEKDYSMDYDTRLESDSRYKYDSLEKFLLNKNFIISKVYSLNGLLKILRVYSNDSGDDLYIYIPSKYPISISSDTKDMVEITKFDPIFVQTETSSNHYDIIDSNGIKNDNYFLDPKNVDRLMEEYRKIDLNGEDTSILQNNLYFTKKQLGRLSNCTNDIKYKICILSNSLVAYVNSENVIETFIVKGIIPNIEEERELCVIIDLENFYDSVGTIHKDIEKIYKTLYVILEKVHEQQTKTIETKIRVITEATTKMVSEYKNIKEYEKTLLKLDVYFEKLRKREKKIIDSVTYLNKHIEKNPTDYDSQTKLKKLEVDFSNILKWKSDLINMIGELRFEYNNYLLQIDETLFDSIVMFDRIYDNFRKSKIIKK